ncbi:hypothetical protein [Streptomyces sp. bgisy022]|uniref:hypothetical protein n=1 Tax=Streptomyces sp. bgisy022 TaxID=3413769 RepID=UPI003D712A68
MTGQPKSPAPTNPRVGLNPTGRLRRSSARSRRKLARRAARGATKPTPKETP